MPEVFISYGRKNCDLVEPLAAGLEELGVEKWIDSGIPTGERYRKEIRSKLKDAKAVVVCWSPEALDSDWVDYEADIAMDYGTYVPVFVAPCVLQPPFSGIQTADLSKWKGEATDPQWLMLIERIAEKISREGVAAAARAMASADERTRYDFAKRYPDEPVARRYWLAHEGRHREAFHQRMADARDRVRARINAEYAELEARLVEAPRAFDTWLAEERRGAAKGPMPDPLAIVERRDGPDETTLRTEIASLSGALARARVRAEQLDAEVRRLSDELQAASAETQRHLSENAAVARELSFAKGEVERLSRELEPIARERDELRAQSETAAAESKTRKQELDAANSLIANLSGQLATARSTGPAGPESAGQKPPVGAGTSPAPEPSKASLLSKRLWTLFWIVGLIVSVVLAIVFFALVNSGSYYERQQSGPVAVWLVITLVFSAFAFRRSRRRRATN